MANKGANRQKRGANRGGSGRSHGRDGGGNKGFYIAIAVIVVAGAAWLLFMRDAGPAEDGVAPVSLAATSAEADSTAGTALGPAGAAVTIREFADFQCPHCRDFNSLTGRILRRDYVSPEGEVRWITYDFPLGFQNSLSSAIAAGCAEAQGEYWVMHDLLFAHQTDWGNDASPWDQFDEYAEQIGLDRAAFNACTESREPLPRIMAARAYGEQLGVRGTPTLFLNGDLVEELSYQSIATRIEQALAVAENTAPSDSAAEATAADIGLTAG